MFPSGRFSSARTWDGEGLIGTCPQPASASASAVAMNALDAPVARGDSAIELGYHVFFKKVFKPFVTMTFSDLPATSGERLKSTREARQSCAVRSGMPS